MLTGVALTGTRRKVKVEKIPFLSTDSLSVKPTTENHHLSAKAADTATCSDDASQTGGEILPLAVDSPDPSLPTLHSKKPLQTENTLHLTTQVQGTVQTKTKEDGLSNFVGESEALECNEQPARTEEKSSRVSSTLNCGMEVSNAELLTDVSAPPDKTQVNSPPTAKDAVNTAAQIERKLNDCVKSETASGRLEGRGKSKPKLINVRCATDAPDQNCKTQ